MFKEIAERIGSRVTGMFRPRDNRDIADVVFHDMMTFNTRKAGIAGPPHRAKAAVKTYTENPWVFGAFNAIVNQAAAVPLYIRKKTINAQGKVEYQRIDIHQALDLLEHPMPDAEADGTSHMNGDTFKRTSMLHMLAEGESLMRINSRLMGKIPRDLSLMYPHCTNVHMNRDTGLIDKYVYYEDGPQEELDPWDVVHLKMTNPASFYRGLSQIIAAGQTIETDKETDSWLLNWFKNSAKPDFVIERETAPKQGEVERFKAAWNEENQGSKNAGKMQVIWGGKVVELSRSQRDMQLIEQKEFSRDATLASLRTSKGALGMMEDANRASAEAFEYMMAKHVVKPFLEVYCKQLTSELLARFPKNMNLEYWFEDFVPDDLVTKSTVWGSGLDRGAVTINEYRKAFGMDPVAHELADKLLVGLGKTTLDDLEGASAVQNATAPTPPKMGDEDTDEDIEDDELV